LGDKKIEMPKNGNKNANRLKEFKRGMLGILKVLAQESLEHQRLDYYNLYKTMHDIVGNYTITQLNSTIDLNILEDEEATARMILKFPSTEVKNEQRT